MQSGGVGRTAGGGPDIAVILPCHNESATVAGVVAAFRAALPGVRVYVFDNDSSDGTAAAAKAAGATVRSEPRRGKGNVICRAFAEVDAEVYVLADGDGTYDAGAAGALVELLVAEHLDMVVGSRLADPSLRHRPGHRAGNRFFNFVLRFLFGSRFEDVFSGYRVLSRPFVKSFPALATAFEVETEMTVHAIQLNLAIAERPTVYRERPEGSASKLRTVRDGVRILLYVLRLTKQNRPFFLFGSVAALAAAASLALGLPVVAEYGRTGLVERFPTAIAAASLMTGAVISFVAGVILDSVAHAHREQKRLAYLRIDRRLP